MKNQLLFLCMVLVALELYGQQAIPNPDFENWTQNSIENPLYITYNSNKDCYRDNLPSNVNRVSPGYSGQYAIELKTVSNHLAYAINTDPREGNIQLWSNGIAYSEMPTGIKGYYKYNVETADSALLIVLFRKNRATIGSYSYKLGGLKTSFTEFAFTFAPALTVAPDSLVFCLVSSDFMKNESGVSGSTLVVDGVRLLGVATQPSELNGDFEQWGSVLMPLQLNDWNLQNREMEGFSRTTDAKHGSYALQLRTYAGEDNNVARARQAYLTSGYWDDVCGCIKGGYPYSLTKDTLAFWYKYAPQSTDMAEVSIQFLKNGTQVGGEHINLNASANYEYVEMPFQLGTAPDRVVVQIASSQWTNSALSYVGSTLIVDHLYFKSSLVSGAQQHEVVGIGCWYGPQTDRLYVRGVDYRQCELSIYTLAGQLLRRELLQSDGVDVGGLGKGLYVVQICYAQRRYQYKVSLY